jgi:cold shock protein
MRVRGVVSWYKTKLCYGFISREDGPDVFVHMEDIEVPSSRELRRRQKVEFEIVMAKKGPRAIEVRVVG